MTLRHRGGVALLVVLVAGLNLFPAVGQEIDSLAGGVFLLDDDTWLIPDGCTVRPAGLYDDPSLIVAGEHDGVGWSDRPGAQWDVTLTGETLRVEEGDWDESWFHTVHGLPGGDYLSVFSQPQYDPYNDWYAASCVVEGRDDQDNLLWSVEYVQWDMWVQFCRSAMQIETGPLTGQVVASIGGVWGYYGSGFGGYLQIDPVAETVQYFTVDHPNRRDMGATFLAGPEGALYGYGANFTYGGNHRRGYVHQFGAGGELQWYYQDPTDSKGEGGVILDDGNLLVVCDRDVGYGRGLKLTPDGELIWQRDRAALFGISGMVEDVDGSLLAVCKEFNSPYWQYRLVRFDSEMAVLWTSDIYYGYPFGMLWVPNGQLAVYGQFSESDEEVRPGFVTFFGEGTGVAEDAATTAVHYELVRVYPNPFNGSATVAVTLPHPSSLRVTVHDLLGRSVAVLHDGPAVAGSQRYTFTPDGLASGTYLLNVVADDQVRSERIVLVK